MLKTCSRAHVPFVLSAHVSTCFQCLCTHVPPFLACLVLTCLCALHANVPTCPACLRAYVLTCLACLRAHLPRCLASLRALVPMCLSANVLTCQCAFLLRCSRANVFCVLTCSFVNVPSSIMLIRIQFKFVHYI